MKKILILSSIILSFATASVFAADVTAPVSTSAPLTQDTTTKSGNQKHKKHAKNHKKSGKHHKKTDDQKVEAK
jgi:opacity protein-like surface antigen